jgi:actin-like ATPase involved in cell morphogenesis
MSVRPGVAIDAGTMNFVSARQDGDKVTTKRIRNAFLDLPPENKRMLKISNTSFVELDGKLLVLGDEALETANLFNREARRPMSGGVVASGEIDAQRVLGLIMKHVLGEPVKPLEKCCYSVPAAALDVVGSNVTYHSKILGKIASELGYDPEPVNEALAVIYSECAGSNFSGLGFSYGSGMTNVCLAFNAMSALEFSVGRGGDWVDSGAAGAVGTTAAKVCALKESGVDLMNPSSREAEAIAVYIESLIDYTISCVQDAFSKKKGEIQVTRPIPIVVSGGTSLVGGFLEKFKERFEKAKGSFPIPISEIRHAKDPLSAVATGLLVLSQMDE